MALERLQETFSFGDGEDAIMEFSIKELQEGHTHSALKPKTETTPCELPV